MMTLFIRLFIPNKEDISDPAVKKAYAALSSVVGILLNLFLCTAKIVAGSLCHSVAISADGFNNLSDAGTNIISFLGFKIAGYGGGNAHPFGHGRVEWIMGIFASIAVLLMGITLMDTSVKAVANPQRPTTGVATIILLVISVLVKWYMYCYNKRFAKITDSETLKATAADCIGDSVATLSVLFSTVLSPFVPFAMDGYCGVVVSVFIIFAGMKSLWEVLGRIMGKAADKDTKEEILQMAERYPEIVSVHDLMLHDYGFGYFVAAMRVEGDRKDSERLYVATHQISCELYQKLHWDCLIQVDYLVEDEAAVHIITGQIASVLEKYREKITIDHFRLIENGSCINIAFDMIYPVALQKREEEIRKELTERIESQDPGYRVLIKGMVRREHLGSRGEPPKLY